MNYAMLAMRARPRFVQPEVGWDISQATFVREFSLGGSSPFGIFWKPDGTRMYVAFPGPDEIREYSIGFPWDVSTSSYSQAFNVSAQSTNVYDLTFNPDGTRMYISGARNSASVDPEVNEYSLSTGWGVSTATFIRNFSEQRSDFLGGVAFSAGGEKMYLAFSEGEVAEYSLTTSWDISTASFTTSIQLVGQNPYGITFRPDGKRMYVTILNRDEVAEYHLASAWDLLTAVRARTAVVVDSPSGIAFKPDGKRVYVTSSSFSDVSEYSLV